jgi:hypothetical protein
MKREDYLKMIRESEEIKSVLSGVTDQKDKRAIKAYTEDFFMRFYDSLLGPIMSELEKDPEVLNKAFSEIEKELINNADQEKK